MSGRLRSIVGHTPEFKSRHTLLCTENTQAIGFSLANYGLYRQSIYVAQTFTGRGSQKSRLLLKILVSVSRYLRTTKCLSIVKNWIIIFILQLAHFVY